MTATEIISIIAQATTSVVVIIGAMSALRTGGKVAELKQVTEETGGKVAELKQVTEEKAVSVDGKLETIHQLTNSNLTAVKSDLAMANEKIGKLQTMLVGIMAEREGEGPPAPTEMVDRLIAADEERKTGDG